MNANKLVISLEGDDELKEYLAKKSPGDTCEFEVTASMDEMTPTQAVFSVKSAEAIKENESYGDDGIEGGEAPEPGEAMPAGPSKGTAAVMIAFGKKKD